ncbi:MAG: hypothetical protein KKC01_02715 [Gammaproteobacteria bacterium]|nr:hypothetical protein [Gammaproteobacteria bacterium]
MKHDIRKPWLMAIVALGLLTPALLPAQDGAAVAGNACAMCHQLTPDGDSAVPSLFDLAAEHAPFSAEQLQSLLQQPQHAVANSMVSEGDLQPLSDYLNELE